MKKIAAYLFVFALFIACGDSDSEDFDPTRVDLVTGMFLTTPEGVITEEWGNPNLPSNPRVTVFPNPASGMVRVVTSDPIQNVWFVSGFPSRRFFDTNFEQVFAQNPYEVASIESSSVRSFENINGTNISLNLEGLGQGYYRLFIQFQDNSLTWDNFYIDTGSPVNLNDINFWN